MRRNAIQWLAAMFLLLLAGVIFYSVDFVFENYPVPDARSAGVSVNDEVRLGYLEHYLEMFRIIVVGVLVALVSVLIPLVYSHARARFERYKEARTAYSRAKTAVLYLADRVLSAVVEADSGAVNENRENASNAFDLIEQAHRELHLAETFEDDIINQGFLEWYDAPRTWVLHNYWLIVSVAAALRCYCEQPGKGDADKLAGSVSELRDKFKETGSIVDDAFGETGGKKVSQAEASLRKGKRGKPRCWVSRQEIEQSGRQVKESFLRESIEKATSYGSARGLRQKEATK